MKLLQFGKEQLPSVLNDPFKKTHVKRIYVSFSENVFIDGKYSANGSVEFANGNTKGEQKFDGDTFDEVVLKIKSFLDNDLQ
jgi:hypothetical protein